jgi:hypothetical protein
MNFLFISPNFPVFYFRFVQALKKRGVTVLGIGDSPYWDLAPELKASIAEYYCADLTDYAAVLKGARYLEKKHGKIDYVESNNEWWLSLDARLREDLGVTTGFHPDEMKKIKAKSAMKACFNEGGAKTMRYVLVNGPEDLEKALAFASEVGWPLFVKPDVGVGAADSYALKDEAALRSFLSKKLDETYIIEEYIDGFIVSFDGICDSNGDVVFCTSDHFPTPVSDVVIKHLDEYYYNNPFSLPFVDVDAASFERTGRAVVKAFGIRKRFFHIEFFVLQSDKPGFAKKGEYVALECNMRPAGGNTPDLIDFANSVSCYDIYADVICYDENRQDLSLPKYYAFAAERRDALPYVHTKEEILSQYKGSLCSYGRYPDSLSDAMGNDYYFAKFKTYEEGMAFDRFVREKKGL